MPVSVPHLQTQMMQICDKSTRAALIQFALILHLSRIACLGCFPTWLHPGSYHFATAYVLQRQRRHFVFAGNRLECLYAFSNGKVFTRFCNRLPIKCLFLSDVNRRPLYRFLLANCDSLDRCAIPTSQPNRNSFNGIGEASHPGPATPYRLAITNPTTINSKLDTYSHLAQQFDIDCFSASETAATSRAQKQFQGLMTKRFPYFAWSQVVPDHRFRSDGFQSARGKASQVLPFFQEYR